MKLSRGVVRVHPKRTFKIATDATDEFVATICRIEHEGVVGFGEASPSTRVSGEDERTVARFLDDIAPEVERLRLGDWEAFLDDLHARDRANPGARCAVDLALHDLVAKTRGVAARELYGIPPARLETSMTVSLDEPSVMAEEAAGYHRAGFRCLKLKLGDAPRDAARVRAVRAACPSARLRADANTGWSVEDARSVLPDLASLGVEFVEQPVGADAIEDLVEISRWSPIPVYADESVHDARDVEALRAAGFAGGMNVKLVKAGGLRPAIRALRLARSLGYRTQLGCNVETAVGICAAAQLLALLDHADLDGHLLLADDPFEGIVPKQGWYVSPSEAGLSARLMDPSRVR